MQTEKQILPALPHLMEIFDLLRKGKHIAPEDTGIYFDLQTNEAALTELFTQLGFELIHHPRGFYYFRGDTAISDTSSKMAVFMFILVESIADAGGSPAEQIMADIFPIENLEHLRRERYRAIMQEAGMVTEEDLRQTLRTMERFGFLKMENADAFRFRTPAYRFLDLCMDIFKENEAAESNQ